MKGILLVDKPKGQTSFSLVSKLRRLTKERCIGHAGTLDPFATGVMVLLIHRQYTQMSDTLLQEDKEYKGRIKLGEETDSYDIDGQIVQTSDYNPSLEEVQNIVQSFQGTIYQTPPMFSAKKINGKKLYTLARQGKIIPREPRKVWVMFNLLAYSYPYIDFSVSCSKGTYIRTIAHDIGKHLGSGAHLIALNRTRSGTFYLEDCIDGDLLDDPSFDPSPHIITEVKKV